MFVVVKVANKGRLRILKTPKWLNLCQLKTSTFEKETTYHYTNFANNLEKSQKMTITVKFYIVLTCTVILLNK